MKTGLGVRPQLCFDARPQQAQRAEFCHGEELIGVGDQPERYRRSGIVECDAAGLQRAQISNRDCKREGEFLRFRSAGIMDGAAVRERKRSLEAAAHEFADHLCKRRRHFGPRRRRRAAHGHGAQRLIIEPYVDLGRLEAAGLDEAGEVHAGIFASEHRIERDGDPGVEKDAIEDTRQCFLRRIGDPKTARARAAGKFKLQTVGAVFEIVQRLRVGGSRIRMIDALHDLPGRGLSAAGDRRGILRARIDRFDLQTVIGLADQFLERRALQHAIDQLAPVVVGRRRKIGGQPQVVSCRCHSADRSREPFLRLSPEIATWERPIQCQPRSRQPLDSLGRQAGQRLPSRCVPR